MFEFECVKEAVGLCVLLCFAGGIAFWLKSLLCSYGGLWAHGCRVF